MPGEGMSTSVHIFQNPQSSVSVNQSEPTTNNSTLVAKSTNDFNIDHIAQMKELLSTIIGATATSAATTLLAQSNLSSVLTPTGTRALDNITVKPRKAKRKRLLIWKNARKRTTGYKKNKTSASYSLGDKHVSSTAYSTPATGSTQAVPANLGLLVQVDSSAFTWTSKEVSPTSAGATIAFPDNRTTSAPPYGPPTLSTILPSTTLQSLTVVTNASHEPTAATIETYSPTPPYVDIAVVDLSSTFAESTLKSVKDVSSFTDGKMKYSSLGPSLEKQQTITLQTSDVAVNVMSWQRENSTESTRHSVTMIAPTPTSTSGGDPSAWALQNPPDSSTVTHSAPNENKVSTFTTTSTPDSNITPRLPKKALSTKISGARATSATTTLPALSYLNSVLSSTGTIAVDNLTVKPRKPKRKRLSTSKYTTKRRTGYKKNTPSASNSLAGEHVSSTVESLQTTESHVDMYLTQAVPAASGLRVHDSASGFTWTLKEESPTSAGATLGIHDNRTTSSHLYGPPTLSTTLPSTTLQPLTVITNANPKPAAATIETSSLTPHVNITLVDPSPTAPAGSLMPVKEYSPSTDEKENYSSLGPSLEKQQTIPLQPSYVASDFRSRQRANSTRSKKQSVTLMPHIQVSTSGSSSSGGALQSPPSSSTVTHPTPDAYKISALTTNSIPDSNITPKVPKKILSRTINSATGFLEFSGKPAGFLWDALDRSRSE
ncbi:uncharacterized protein [Pleurodeles waltl]|uniref:uncharacterized protein n=1 Tax=Pleurodeles waltl TaxID=8319 RepID=UPI003709B435